MTTVFPNNSAYIGERTIINNATIAGQKRPFLVSDSYSDAETYHLSAKRSSHCTYWSPTDNSNITVSSPKTPESGIDMNELGSSPPCYSVTRTASFYENSGGIIPQTDLTTTITACGTSELQPDQYKEGFYLVITDEPEENYRARYDSEGCRGPMKGRNGGCPTVELRSTKHHWGTAEIRVELVAADKSPLNSCKLDSTDEGSNLLKNAHPSDPRVSFENLRIRRLKKGDTNSRSGNNSTSIKHHQPKQTLKGTRSKQDEKVAYLLFTARVQTSKFDYSAAEVIELKALSQAIHLNASHDPPEIHTVVPQYAAEGDSVAIIGTRMHSPRVSFLYNIDGKDQEVMADINKEVSHQNALVIKVPSLPVNSFNSNIANVHICVTAGKGDRTGKEPLKSNPFSFYCVFKGVCKECVMTTARQSHPFYGHQTQQSLPRQQTTPTRSPRIDSKQLLMNPSRQIIHPAKSISPRPTPPTPAPPTTSQQTPSGYMSPPPHTAIPVTASNSFSTNFTTGSINQQQIISPSVCQSSPQAAAQIDHTSSTDVVADLLSTLCPTGGNSIEHCPVTPPQTSPAQQQCYSVVHSESIMDGIGGFGGGHSGPVSPDEFNRYLPNNANNTSQAISNAFVPVSSTCPINSQPQQQEFTGVVFTGGNTVQPCSMGHFPQNL